MFKHVLLASSLICLGACGGSSLSSSNSDEPEPSSDTSSYLDYMKSTYSEHLGADFVEGSDRVDLIAAETDGAVSAPVSEDQSYQGYSETNVQIAGVDEADYLKFDGQNLLWLSSTSTSESTSAPIVRNYSEDVLNGNAVTDNSLHFSPDDTYNYQGLLRHDEQAVLVGSSRFWYGWDIWDLEIALVDCYITCSSGPDEIVVHTWPYSQSGVPLIPELDTLTIDGALIETRLIGDKLFVISQFSPQIDYAYNYPQNAEEREANQLVIDALSIDDLVPSITINDDEALLFDAAECQIAEKVDSEYRLPNVISITEIDINSPSEWQSTCYVGNTNNAFVSRENVYLTRDLWYENQVEIVKFALTDEGPEYRAKGRVAGSQSYDSYYFGEVDGKLAYVNTVYDQNFWWTEGGRHQLSVFDENGESLEIVAQIPNESAPDPIGKPGEQIYAVRFMGERAYVVTFDRIDPLYVIDLSSPEQPEILGELEIPGFSSYIHVINDELLLGVGMNATEEDGGVWTQGLNVRLFDVSEPSQPIAIESLDFGLRGSGSAVLSDPHAFTFVYEEESERFRFAIPMRLHGNIEEFDPELPASTYYDWQETSFVQFEVDTGLNPSLSEVGRFQVDEQYYFGQLRSAINEGLLYISNDSELHVVEWTGTEALRSFPEN